MATLTSELIFHSVKILSQWLMTRWHCYDESFAQIEQKMQRCSCVNNRGSEISSDTSCCRVLPFKEVRKGMKDLGGMEGMKTNSGDRRNASF